MTQRIASRIAVLPHLDTDGYERSTLHADERVWVEKNCYVDIWIEVLHSLRLEPLAMLGFALAIDFEDDQWTFFKPPHDELRELYGVDVQELNVWRPLIEHAIEHLAAGKFISTEADAFWLPDTAGTDYRRNHSKTTIVLAEIDTQAHRLGYFHNAAYHRLEGEDYAGLFRIGAPPDPLYLPLFAELIRIDRLVHRTPRELAARAVTLLRRHVARLPAENPVARFRRRFEQQDLLWLQDRGLAFYHAWAFGTIRQLGAAFELVALHLQWLGVHGGPQLPSCITAFDTISTASKTLILKVARAVNSKRTLDAGGALDAMEHAWSDGVSALQSALS